MVRGAMEHPWGVYGTPIEIKIKHPLEALFVIVLKTPTKELPKLPIFNIASSYSYIANSCQNSASSNGRMPTSYLPMHTVAS